MDKYPIPNKCELLNERISTILKEGGQNENGRLAIYCLAGAGGGGGVIILLL